jgi:hypothetical protein
MTKESETIQKLRQLDGASYAVFKKLSGRDRAIITIELGFDPATLFICNDKRLIDAFNNIEFKKLLKT